MQAAIRAENHGAQCPVLSNPCQTGSLEHGSARLVSKSVLGRAMPLMGVIGQRGQRSSTSLARQDSATDPGPEMSNGGLQLRDGGDTPGRS
jgi:hypothetical protein